MRINLLRALFITLSLGFSTIQNSFSQISNLVYPSTACEGEVIEIKFNAAPGNYSALLVSTDTLIALGTITPSAGNVTIPMGVAEGNYKIRVKTAADSLTGSSDIAIKQIPVAPTIATVLNNVCPGTLVDQALLNSTINSGPGTLVWYNQETGGAPLSSGALTVNTNITGTTTFWVARLVGTCESPRTQVTVKVVEATPKPTVSDVSACLNETPAPTLNATGENLKWYTVASGGSGSTTKPVLSTNSAGTTNYYVTQTLNNCESERAAITYTVKQTPPPTVTANVSYCQGETPAPLAATGTGLLWYTTPTGGTGTTTKPAVSTANADTLKYYVSQTVNGCESPRAEITVIVRGKPEPPEILQAPDSVCVGATVPASAFINAIKPGTGTLVWYNVANGGSPLSQANITVNTNSDGIKSLWVARRIDNCEGERTKVDLVVKPLPAAPGVTDVTACLGESPAPQLTATGSNLKWYNAGGSLLPQAPTVQTGTAGVTTYGVTQTVNGCESPKATIKATVYNTNAPSVTSTVAYCKGDTPEPLKATGTALKWYTTATGGTGSSTAPTVSTDSVGTKVYYVSQTLNGCESERARIDVRIKDVPPAPTVVNLPDACEKSTVPASQLLGAVKTATGTLKWYTTATGGTGTATAPTPSTTTSGVKNFYVTQSIEACESPRALIKLEVKQLPVAPTVTASLDLCHQEPNETPLKATPVTGNTLNWYTVATGGNALEEAPVPSTSTVKTTSYYVSQTHEYSEELACEGPRAKIDVIVNPLPVAAVTTDRAVCQTRTDETLNFSAKTSGTGNTLVWFPDDTTKKAETTTPSLNLKTAGEFEYFVAQKSNKECIGVRKPVKIRVKRLPGLPNVSDVEYCQFDDAEPLTAKLETGATPNWYGQNATGGNASTNPPKPSTENGGTYSFYVSQTLEACEGDRAQIKVLIKTTPKPETQTLLEYCHNAPATPLSANGQRLKWYRPTGEIQTNPFTPFTEAVGDQYFYVTQTGDNNCESPKEEIKITVHPLPSATISGQSSIPLGGSADIKIEFTGKGPWSYKLSNGDSGTTNNSTTTVRVSPAFTTTYLVTEVSNECGNGTPNGSAVVTVLRPTITTGNPSVVNICAGSDLIVPFQQSGSFPAGSKFVVQLGKEDSDEHFKTIPSTVSGNTITGTLPDTLAGGNYFIRVVSENPNPDLTTPGSTSGVSITVDPKPTATLPADRTIFEGESTTLSITLTGAEPWTFSYSDGTQTNTVTTSTSPYQLVVTPLQSVVYTITSIENRCGPGRSIGETFVQVDKILSKEASGWVRVLPTVADNTCRVELEVLSNDGAQLMIYDLSGRTVRTMTLTSEITPIDMSTLPSGVYVFRVVNGQSMTVSKVLKP